MHGHVHPMSLSDRRDRLVDGNKTLPEFIMSGYALWPRGLFDRLSDVDVQVFVVASALAPAVLSTLPAIQHLASGENLNS